MAGTEIIGSLEKALAPSPVGEGWGEGKPIPYLSRISKFGIAAKKVGVMSCRFFIREKPPLAKPLPQEI
jgi:hypothetical protein